MRGLHGVQEKTATLNVSCGCSPPPFTHGSGGWRFAKMRPPDVLRAVPVFDCSQVKPLPDREPAPLEPPTQPITDDSNRRLLGPLHAIAGELGYRVDEREDSGAADGWCDHDNKLIVVAGHLAGNAKAGVLLHELAHAVGIGYADYGRARAPRSSSTQSPTSCVPVRAWRSRSSRCPTSPGGGRRTRWPRFISSPGRSTPWRDGSSTRSIPSPRTVGRRCCRPSERPWGGVLRDEPGQEAVSV